MKRSLFAVAIALAFAPVLFSQSQAVVKEFKGKVEIKASGGDWRPVTAGMKLDTGASISTGFSSTALLDLGTSTLKVAPLTRMQLVELIARQGSVSTTLALKVGKVNAEVKTAQGLRQDFTLKGPQATAAVRGTEFEFDGVSVKVINGLVFFSNTQGQGRGVGAGEGSSTGGGGLPTTGDQQNESLTSIDPHTSAGGTGLAASGGPLPTATVTIRWQ
jgi:FecR protein